MATMNPQIASPVASPPPPTPPNFRSESIQSLMNAAVGGIKTGVEDRENAPKTAVEIYQQNLQGEARGRRENGCGFTSEGKPKHHCF